MIKRTTLEWLFGLFAGGWWHWCKKGDPRLLFSQLAESTGGAPRTPPPWRRGPEDWEQYVVIRITATKARQIYPAFRSVTGGLGISVRLGDPIEVPNSGEMLLRFGVGSEPCGFGVAVAHGDGILCGAEIVQEYRVVREPGGKVYYFNLDRDPINEPDYDAHV